MNEPGAEPFSFTEDMRRLVSEQRLGFVATVCPDGTPNLSPKGTTSIWDDRHLVFADLRSPQTIRNIQDNVWAEVNVVDPFARKGYRFKGTCRILQGDEFQRSLAFFSQGERGVVDAQTRIRHVVLIEVVHAAPLTSPAYDLGATEDQLRAKWVAYHLSL